MKSKMLATIILTGLVVLLGACSTAQGANNTITPSKNIPPAPGKYAVVITDEDFNETTDIAKQIEVKIGDTFTISLDSNATTGFSWTEQAIISDENILEQNSHQYIEPQTESDMPTAGRGDSEEWTFKANQTGTAKITLSYDRPWEGGEKGVRNFELTVVVQ